jgi:predicted dehydrogenase
MQPIRLGFVGAGVMATWAIYPALHFAPFELRAVCDLDEARARQVANTFGARNWYTDYRHMWAQEDLEALIIQMHPAPRQPIVKEALDAGYHVFIPKPPAMSLADTRELAAYAARAGKLLMVNFQRRFSFAVDRARTLMAQPAFGPLTQLHCSFCSGQYDERRSAGYADPVQAFLLDFSVHHLDLARYLGGEVAQLALFHRQGADASSYAVALEFENGAVGTLQLNSQRLWWRNYDRIEITGQGAYLVLDGLWSIRHYAQAENTFTENYSDERSGELTGDGLALVEFAEAIRANRQPVANIHDCVSTMRLYQALYDAVCAGRDGLLDTRAVGDG